MVDSKSRKVATKLFTTFNYPNHEKFSKPFHISTLRVMKEFGTHRLTFALYSADVSVI